jgi:hypothetical protein
LRTALTSALHHNTVLVAHVLAHDNGNFSHPTSAIVCVSSCLVPQVMLETQRNEMPSGHGRRLEVSVIDKSRGRTKHREATWL